MERSAKKERQGGRGRKKRAIYYIYKGISVQQYRTRRPPHFNSELVKVEHLWWSRVDEEEEEEEGEEKVRGKQRERKREGRGEEKGKEQIKA